MQIQANENTMLWARGLIDAPSYQPVAGPDSCEVESNFAKGWPVRLQSNQRIAIGVQTTCKDSRVKRYAVSLMVGAWMVVGSCASLAPGQATEARSWFYGYSCKLCSVAIS